MFSHITDTIASGVHADSIAKFERSFGLAIPASYRSFLLKYNGGRPSPDSIRADLAPQSPWLTVDYFYGYEATLDCYDLRWNYELWVSDCPRKLLPIACDSGGSSFCISVSGDDVDRVYYRDWHRGAHPWYGNEFSAKPRYPWTYLVALTFDELLARLEHCPDGV